MKLLLHLQGCLQSSGYVFTLRTRTLRAQYLGWDPAPEVRVRCTAHTLAARDKDAVRRARQAVRADEPLTASVGR